MRKRVPSTAVVAIAPPPWTRADVVVLAAVLGISAALVWPELFRGWYPWDDGGMAQVADRVLHGQLPHRDFDDPWTGGWSFVQAGIFRLFGTSLRMLRIPIFVTWLGSLACGFRLARRFHTPLVAGIATLSWGVWSLYAWHYPLLNWYYAPLALFTAWGVTRFVESGQRRYVVLAGATVGIAITFKITGLYLLAAVLLWGAAHVAQVARHTPVRAHGWGYTAFVSGAGALFGLLVAGLVLRSFPKELHGSALFLFALPSAVTVLWLGWSAYTVRVAAGEGIRALGMLLLLLAVGVAMPLVPFLLVYAAHGAMGDLIVGVFVRPLVRLSIFWFESTHPGRVAAAGMMLAPLVLALGVRYAAPVRSRAIAVLAVLLGAFVGVLAQRDQFTAGSAALMVRGLPVILPVVALWGTWRREEEPGPYGSVVFLLVACAATAQLLQVPSAYMAYAIYATPIAFLAYAALLAQRSTTSSPSVLFVGLFLIVAGFGHPALTLPGPAHDRWARLALPRGGLWVSPGDSALFQQVAQVMSGRPEGPIHVVGDAPYYSFLLKRKTSSRVIYDMLSDSTEKDAGIVLPKLTRAGVQTVLLQESVYDDSLTVQQKRALRREFPLGRKIGSLEIRWRRDSLP